MIDIQFELAGGIDAEVLDEELRDALGEEVVGVSVGPGGLTVHVTDDAKGVRGRVQAIVMDHDPGKLSRRQAKVQERLLKRHEARLAAAEELDDTRIADLPELNRRVRRLEQEVLAILEGLRE